MPEFVPLKDDKKETTPKPENGNNQVVSEVQKAKDAAEIQKYKTMQIEEQRKATFAENDIKDTTDLKTKTATLTEKETKLAKDFMDFENKKSLEISEIQKQKAEYERRLSELAKREQDLSTRIRNVELRERLVGEREQLMNSVEKLKLIEKDKESTLVEQLKKSFPQVADLMEDNADILDRAGFHGFADGVFEDIDKMRGWHKNNIADHAQTMVEWLKEQAEGCNSKAVLMAQNPKVYSQKSWDLVVDNLETVYGIMPFLNQQQQEQGIELQEGK